MLGRRKHEPTSNFLRVFTWGRRPCFLSATQLVRTNWHQSARVVYQVLVRQHLSEDLFSPAYLSLPVLLQGDTVPMCTFGKCFTVREMRILRASKKAQKSTGIDASFFFYRLRSPFLRRSAGQFLQITFEHYYAPSFLLMFLCLILFHVCVVPDLVLETEARKKKQAASQQEAQNTLVP